MTKLLKLLETMQSKCAEYLEPGPYHELSGSASATEHDAQAQEALFIGDMIYFLDGPEQREAQFDFLKESARTVSPEFYGHFADYDKLLGLLFDFVHSAARLDRYKKLMFYGEDPTKNRVRDEINGGNLGKYNGHAMVYRMADASGMSKDKMIDLLHAVLGIATEAGEMVEAIVRPLSVPGAKLDTHNIHEEGGDIKWYLAMIARLSGHMWDDDERTVIAKLRERFPDKFTSERANVRDLDAERSVIEGHPPAAKFYE